MRAINNASPRAHDSLFHFELFLSTPLYGKVEIGWQGRGKIGEVWSFEIPFLAPSSFEALAFYVAHCPLTVGKFKFNPMSCWT